MSPSLRNRSAAQWPFWLLIVAWVCANSPQIALCALLAWMGEARHFSHQQRLTAEVAHVLTGASSESVLAALPHLPAKPLEPLAPATLTLKKVELSMEVAVEVVPSTGTREVRPLHMGAWPRAWRAAPPHEPPRAGIAV